jgi:hypothetical protein
MHLLKITIYSAMFSVKVNSVIYCINFVFIISAIRVCKVNVSSNGSMLCFVHIGLPLSKACAIINALHDMLGYLRFTMVRSISACMF